MTEDDPDDDFSMDDFAEEVEPVDPSAMPTPTYPGGSAGRASYCTNCGTQLTGLHIGEPCPNCGRLVGTGSAGNAGNTNGKAITSMVLGICSIPVCFCYGIFSIILGVIGLIFGIVASKEIESGGYAESSKGMALAGKICSWVGIGLGAAYIVLVIAIIIIAESS